MSTFTSYFLHFDLLLTWFPVGKNATLKEPRIRMDTYKYLSDSIPPNAKGRFIGQDLGGADAGLDSQNLVRAFTTTSLDEDEVFSVEFEVGLGRSVRRETLRFQSSTKTPFLFNLRAGQGESPELHDTAVAFQGVVTAGPRRSELIYDVNRIILAVSTGK